jgi:O-antigen/teichoic acid export membrane protein
MPSPLTSKILKSFKQMFAGAGINTVFSIISGYFYAAILGPGVYGVWQTARIIIGYASFINLGMPFYVQKELPALKGEGKSEEANYLVRLVISFTFISFPLIGLILLGSSFFPYEESQFGLSLIALAIWFVITIPAGIGTILNKAVNDYKTVSVAESITGIGSMLIIPFIIYFGFKALLIGFLLTTLVQSIYYFAYRPYKYHWYWNSKLLKTIIFTAFPLFLVRLAASLFSSSDRVIIASMMDFKSVGLYSLSSFISTPISLLVTTFTMVLFTQLNERYGRSTEKHVVEKHVFIPQRIFSNLIPPVIGMGLVALPLFTKILLPKYTEGIVAAQINIFAIFFYLLAGFSANALFVLNKQKISAASFLIAGIFKVGGSIIAILLGFGITGVAVFSVVGYFVYDTIMLYFVSKNLQTGFKEFFNFLTKKLFCPLLVLVTCILYTYFSSYFYSYFHISNQWIQLVIGELIIILASFSFFIVAYKEVRRHIK